MQDVLRREEPERGRDARQRLKFKLLTTDQLDDVMAALAFLKTVPGIDIRRIAIAGITRGQRDASPTRLRKYSRHQRLVWNFSEKPRRCPNFLTV
jgi:hypothetical protein